MSDALMITESQAADLLGFEPDTLRRWRRQSRGPAYCQFGRAVRYMLRDVEAYIAAGRVGQDAEIADLTPPTTPEDATARPGATSGLV